MVDRILQKDAKRTAEFSITIKGARSRQAALSYLSDMVKPEARATVIKIAESPNGFKQDGDSYTLSGLVCCEGDKYYLCAEGDYYCTYAGEGCPA
jgi:hypothetical protein